MRRDAGLLAAIGIRFDADVAQAVAPDAKLQRLVDANVFEAELRDGRVTYRFAQRPVQDTILNIAQRNLFGRFPNLQVVSVENGSGWVKPR